VSLSPFLIAKLNPSSSSSWAELALVSLCYYPPTQPPGIVSKQPKIKKLLSKICYACVAEPNTVFRKLGGHLGFFWIGNTSANWTQICLKF
jgi:hypothetical protein